MFGRGRGLLTLLKIFFANISYNVGFAAPSQTPSPLINKCVELQCVKRKLENEPHCSYLQRHLCGCAG